MSRPAIPSSWHVRVAFAVALLSGSLASMAATVEERLADLEKKVTELSAENAALKKELGISKEGGTRVLVSPGGKETKLVLGGFIHANAEFGGTPDSRWEGINDRFFLRRARLNLTATFAENFLARIETDIGNNSISATSGYRAQLTDAFVQWSKSPEFLARVGQFKTPFGYEQLSSDLKTPLIEKSLSNDRLTVGRQIGLGVSGDVAEGRFSYAAGVFNGNGTNNAGNDNEKFMMAGRLSAVLFDGKAGEQKIKWTTGVNAFSSEDKGTFVGDKEGFGIDSQLLVGPVELYTEWLRNKLSPKSGSENTAEGWSVMAALNFSQKWQGGLRFENYDSNKSLGGTTSETWSVGITHLLRGNDLKFSLNYLFGNPPPSAADDGRFLARLQVIF